MDNEKRLVMITALRSGDYNQHRGSIGWSDGYCCIGVGHLALGGPDTNTPEWRKAVKLSATDDAAKTLGLNVAEREALVDCNDNRKLSFPQIADFMESEEFLRLGTL